LALGLRACAAADIPVPQTILVPERQKTMFTDLLKSLRTSSLFSPEPRGRRRTPAPSIRPSVEQFDERCMLSAGVGPFAALPLEPGHAAAALALKSGHHQRNHFRAQFPNRSITPLVAVGHQATLRGTIVDGDPRNGNFVLQVSWGDSTAPQVFSFPGKPSRQIEVDHVFQEAGVHTVHLIWHDFNPALGFGPAISDDLQITTSP
jgi:hypothetical protein